MLTAGIIGCGYWGPNLIRNLDKIESVHLKYIADLDTKKLEQMKNSYPYVNTTKNYKDILNDQEVDMVLIATPVSTHYRFAKEALWHGKHVFVEKPLTDTIEEGEELCNIASINNLTLMVGHTFVYTGSVRKIKEVIDNGEIGDILSINSKRLNLGLFQKDTNVIWDLAPHDLSIIHFLLNTPNTTALNVHAINNIHPVYEDTANINIVYNYAGKKVTTSIELSWLYPEKTRKMTIVGTKGMIIYDETEPVHKVKLFNKRVELKEEDNGLFSYEYQNDDTGINLILDKREPLMVEILHFIECINNSKKSDSNGYEGLKIVKILTELEQILTNSKRNLLIGIGER